MSICKKTPLSIACLLLSLTTPTAFAQQSSLDNWTLSVAGLTRLYSYENDDLRKELSDETLNLLGADDFTGSEEDIVNLSVGVGYYMNDHWHLGVTYTDGIELDAFDFSFSLFGDGSFFSEDADLTIITVESRHHLYSFTESLDFFVNAGIAFNDVTALIEDVDNGERTLLVREDISKIGVNAGLGLVWNFAGNFNAIARYNHYTFLSIDEVSVTFEYRF